MDRKYFLNLIFKILHTSYRNGTYPSLFRDAQFFVSASSFLLAVVMVLFASPFVIPFPDPTLLFSFLQKPRTDSLPERHPIEADEPHAYQALVIGC